METYLALGVVGLIHGVHVWFNHKRESRLMGQIDRLENKVLSLASPYAAGSYAAGQVVAGDNRVLRRDDATEAELAQMFEGV